MTRNRKSTRRMLLGATAIAGALALAGQPAAAQERQQYEFNIPVQPLSSALRAYGVAADQQIVFTDADTRGRTAPQVKGSYTADEALQTLLAGTGLYVHRRESGLLQISASPDPQGGSAAGNAVEALIVTAQKREEDIQDVPIAISAFSQEDLTRSQVAGGPDLMTQVPNMTFTKTNFTSYSIQIRGIGTQAISATTDAAVAVAFNNTPFIRNRFFEQEFYDLERVEVLRGPQGTLYGRNATAGVVNIISAKPKFYYEAGASADIANFKSTRVEAMVNVPLVEDAVALRLAGAWTKRDGFVTNQVTGNPIDGRDLWSTRLSLRLAPTDRIDANLIWEHFEEKDDRLRSGKQLCKTDEITEVSGHMPDGTAFAFPTTHYQILPELGLPADWSGVQGTFSQGCQPSSLYSPDSFQTPNGISLPYYAPLAVVFLPTALDDPYLSRIQSHDLRVIESTVDPNYRANNDTFELQLRFNLTDDLSLTSETAYSADSVFSMQDFNRFTTASGAWLDNLEGQSGSQGYRAGVLEDGVFCDPQVGCADRLVAVDLSTGDTRQFSQEIRVGSDFDGPFNFSLGANFLRADVLDKYYVFINSLSLVSAISPQAAWPKNPYEPGVSDNSECLQFGPIAPDPNATSRILQCTYIDPNPIGSLNDKGHNYFLSKNPYKLISYAVFGEAYYNFTDSLKVTAGLRWTVDKKQAPLIPSWLFAGNNVGYPVAEVVDQEWREPTGRLAVDWKPDLGFTDETLLYASYAHGYKAGGANPPTYGKALYHYDEIGQTIIAQSATHPKTFDAEFIDAFEFGTKNTFLDGNLTLNLAAFYYDYDGYQISQIVDRSASNLNFDAEVWGLEIETDWRPLENLRLAFKGGYENTRVADGEKAIDIMDRTAGHEDWVVVRPFPSVPSNCIVPAWLYVGSGPIAASLNGGGGSAPHLIQVGGPGGGNPGVCEEAYVLGHDPITALPYVADPVLDAHAAGRSLGSRPGYPGWNPATAPNNGEGFDKDLSGNELPNAPHFTATLSADYTLPLSNDWLANLHADFYYQSEAWTRIFNTEGYDKLKAYTNVNLAAIFTNEAQGWRVMAYVKNVFDKDSITGAFLNSDDTGLTTNVFLTEPRLYGVRVTKTWDGGPLLGNFGVRREAGEPYPFTVEIGGQVQWHDASNEALSPSFIGAFSPGLDPRGDQEIDLDRGDGREVKLTYASGDWRLKLGARYGRTNGSDRDYRSESGDSGCQALKYYTANGVCEAPESYIGPATNWSASEGYRHEDHAVVDFMVGHDVGLGAFGGDGASILSAGLRYAKLRSKQSVSLYGIPDWDIPSGAQYTPLFVPLGLFTTAHRYRYSADVDRDFDGAGPVVSWDASSRLFGDSDVGHVDLEWSLAGGVLFGKQKVSIAGQEKTEDLSGAVYPNGIDPIATTTTPVAISRSDSASVPLLDLSLGLVYKIDRMSIGAGYRWERYFDAIDGGYSAASSYDRAIDGPYFKIAIGFGG